MKIGIMIVTLILSISQLASAGSAAKNAGEAIFKAKCASCHPDGGNIVNPSKTLKGLKDPKKIIEQMRKGGSGMPAFDAKSISIKDAKSLAGYIIKTFKK